MTAAITTSTNDTQRKREPQNPLVFISHNTRDAELAAAFSKLLVSVSAGLLKSFRSSDAKGTQGIDYGVEWYSDIMTKLDNATDVVCLLTKNSFERPWILYEAGVAKGKMNKQVLGIALGIPLGKVSTGPFAQFQNCTDDANSIGKLVIQLLKRIPDVEPDEEFIREQVTHFIETASSLYDSETDEADSSSDSSVAKLFEEIKFMYQELPRKIRDSIDHNQQDNSRRIIHPRMLREIMQLAKDRRVATQMLLATIKNDFPWLFDAGKDVLNVPVEEHELLREKIESFHNLVRLTFETPLTDMMDLNSDDRFFGEEFHRLFKEQFDSFLEEDMVDTNNP
ncbi:MAG: toll/interleukin-1 receptor domain-containing protein [Oscillospiraceae bacterium]|jgi:hypothetical protein|nr:toll/interleukin-1 receptor domain-containing protein [Oscillospiraceae bacterium]